MDYGNNLTPAQVEAIMQKRLEELTEKLRESEERWQLALEGSQLGVWDWDLENKTVFFCKKWKAMLGYEDHEIKNTYEEWVKLIHPEDQGKVLNELMEHIAGQLPTYKLEHRLRCKNGHYKWFLASGTVMSRSATGQALRVVGTMEDIHAAKLLKERLRLSENTFFSAFHFSAIGIAFVSLQGAWTNVNPALCQLLGYSREELLQMTFQDVTHPDDLAADLKYVQKMLSKEIKSYQMEKRYIHKNGQIIWIMLTVSLGWNAEDKPEFFIAQIIDISQTRYLISALEQSNATLQLTALDLEGKIKQLEEFNNIVAHNLRGAASNIGSLIGMLPDAVPEISQQDCYKMLTQSNKNLKDTLNDLMQVIEVRLNRQIAFDACDLEELITKVTAALSVQVSDKKAIIEKNLQVPIISYPKVYLGSTLYNLISNALKYSHPERRPVIKISTYLENDQLVLSVRDNGLGIDLKRYGDRIFKLNQVFHEGLDSKGAGLFMTKNQIESFGGRISVESVPGEGTAFIVRF